MFGVKYKSMPSGPSEANGYADPLPELQDTSSGSTTNPVIMGQPLSESILDIGDGKEAYLFRVALPGVRTDFCELKCEIKFYREVHIQGSESGGQIIRKQSQIFHMCVQQLWLVGLFYVSFEMRVLGQHSIPKLKLPYLFIIVTVLSIKFKKLIAAHYTGMDIEKDMTSPRKPVKASYSDKLFLLNFIMCSYLGPDVYSDKLRSSRVESAKSSPLASENLGSSFLGDSHLQRLYYYVPRNANSDLVFVPSMFYMYLNGS